MEIGFVKAEFRANGMKIGELPPTSHKLSFQNNRRRSFHLSELSYTSKLISQVHFRL
jgi:hypothetical protein